MMATYPIFAQDAGQRIAINPERVASIIEIEPGRVVVILPDSASATISMTLESVIDRLTGKRELSPKQL
jgi:hypothetical protein